MQKQSTKTATTRTRLLDTAGQLFRCHGFHATGLDEILKRSGTPKGSLYHYFPGGKDQLAIETLDHFVAQLEQGMSALLSSSSDPLKALRKFLRLTVNSLAESDFRDGCPLAAITLDIASDREPIREACEKGFATWLRVLVQHLKRAGLTEARAKSMATLFLASLEGGTILSRAQKSVAPLNTVANELMLVIQASLAQRS
jgi:TetR/AcrR family transcriptional repressor of lmrAB and yxaGH operons